MYNEVFRQIRFETRAKRIPDSVKSYFSEPVYNNADSEITLGDTLSSNINISDDVISTIHAVDFYNSMPERFRKMIILYMHEYTQKEIGDKLGIAQTQVSRYFKKIRDMYADWHTK